MKWPTRPQFAWAMYDWANSAFAVTVIAGFFPLFFKQYWSGDAPVTTSTLYLGIGTSLANLLIMLSAPALGALADHTGRHKRYLTAFAGCGIAATAALYLVAAGNWPAAIILYVLASIGFSSANIFYDSMLLLVSDARSCHRISALGYALGYLGGGLLFLLNVVMTLQPAWFGLPDVASAVRWSFISVSIWWAVFTIPLLRGVPNLSTPDSVDPPAESSVDRQKNSALDPPAQTQMQSNSEAPAHVYVRNSTAQAIRSAFGQVFNTLRSARSDPRLWRFLLAYWLYIDGVATIIRLAIDYGLSIGLPSNSLIIALLMVQFIGFPATLVFGRIGERFGARVCLLVALVVYCAVTIYGYFMNSATEFYVLAGVIGLVQGAVQSLSRSLFGQLVPPARRGEYFGFLNMMGKAAAVIGPALVGITGYLTNNPRAGLLSVILLLGSGMWLLTTVNTDDTDRPGQRA